MNTFFYEKHTLRCRILFLICVCRNCKVLVQEMSLKVDNGLLDFIEFITPGKHVSIYWGILFIYLQQSPFYFALFALMDPLIKKGVQ